MGREGAARDARSSLDSTGCLSALTALAWGLIVVSSARGGMGEAGDGRAGRSSLDPPLFLNAALTDLDVSSVTVHVGAKLQQAPLHPVKMAPVLFGVALRVTSVPVGYASEQSEPQLIPA